MSGKKHEYPPQGGEAKLCFTIFVALVLCVLSIVTIIYSSVLVYVPSLRVLGSNYKGPLTCTTIESRQGLRGQAICNGWSSCEEWCLGVSAESCSHVWAMVRRPGVNITLNGCNAKGFIDETCDTLEDLEEIDCKVVPMKSGQDTGLSPKFQSPCLMFDHEVVISCFGGECRNISEVYTCTFKSIYDDVREQNDGLGQCWCNLCPDRLQKTRGFECSPLIGSCLIQMNHQSNLNGSMSDRCSRIGCQNCWQICHSNKQCFDMASRRDPVNMGLDEWDRPLRKYYRCNKGHCVEIRDLKCARKCKDISFPVDQISIILLNGERIVADECNEIVVDQKKTSLNLGAILMTSCMNVTVNNVTRTIEADNCVNGTWVKTGYPMEPILNYSQVLDAFLRNAEQVSRREADIPHEESLMIANVTKLKVNIEGCVNTLMGDCARFYEQFGKDGRNSTARSVFPCFFNPEKPDFAILDYDKQKAYLVLITTSSVPVVLLFLTCVYLCICQRVTKVGDDGRMRMWCCGKPITGIGNVQMIPSP